MCVILCHKNAVSIKLWIEYTFNIFINFATLYLTSISSARESSETSFICKYKEGQTKTQQTDQSTEQII